MSAPILLSLKAAAVEVGFSEDTMRRAIRATAAVDKDGKPIFPPPLKAKNSPKGYRVKRADLEAWVDSLPDA